MVSHGSTAASVSEKSLNLVSSKSAASSSKTSQHAITMPVTQKQIPAKRSNPFASNTAPSSSIEHTHAFRKTRKADVPSTPALGIVAVSTFVYRGLILLVVLRWAGSNCFWRTRIQSGWKWFMLTHLVII